MLKNNTTLHYFPRHADTDYIYIADLDRLPANVSYLSPSPDNTRLYSNIEFKWYPRSQHLSIENSLPQSYYEDYVMTTTHSEKIQKLQKKQLEKLLTLSGGRVKSLVEIGCGDGSFMEHAVKIIPRCLGIESSKSFGDEAIRKGLNLIIGYVGGEMLLTSEKFDTFVSRQVFEHLDDPLDVLISIRKMLNQNAIGLIEVPNGFRSLRMKRFYDFFPDHINYYSVNSLVALATEAGFNVINCSEVFDGDYLELWIRNEIEVEKLLRNMNAHRDLVCNTLKSKVSELTEQGNKVVIWGCGAKTLTILAASSKELLCNIICIVDSDPHKHGLYVPNTKIQVISPDQLPALNPDVVFVLALSYREEIAKNVRKILPQCEQIFTIDDNGLIAKL